MSIPDVKGWQRSRLNRKTCGLTANCANQVLCHTVARSDFDSVSRAAHEGLGVVAVILAVAGGLADCR